MISKTEFSGWWDQVRMQAGWSNKIPKWKWVLLQTLIPILIVAGIFWIIVLFTNDATWWDSIWVAVFIAVFSGLFGHRGWNRDQQKIEEKKETVTL